MRTGDLSRRPDFYIVGAPKCGTTALFRHLGRHPDIFVPALKEPQFFGDDLHWLNATRFTVEQYLSLFGGAGETQCVGEGSTTYLQSESAPTEIKAFTPDARIIIMLREPVAVMHAYHGEMVAGGFEPIGDFAAALEAEADRREGRRLPKATGGIRECLYYRRVTSFAAQVERYYAVFGRARVRVILFDDWVKDADQVYAETLTFLGVDPSFAPSLTRENPSRRTRSASIQRFLAEPPEYLRRVVRVIPQRTRARVVRTGLRLNTTQGNRAPIAPELHGRLVAEAADDVERLEKLLGRDLSAWRKAPEEAVGPAPA